MSFLWDCLVPLQENNRLNIRFCDICWNTRFGTTRSHVYLFKWIKYSLCSSEPDSHLKTPTDYKKTFRFFAALFWRSFQEDWKKKSFLINLANRWFGGMVEEKKKQRIWSQCKHFSCIEHVLSLDVWARLSPFFNVSKPFVCEGSFRSVFLLINCR